MKSRIPCNSSSLCGIEFKKGEYNHFAETEVFVRQGLAPMQDKGFGLGVSPLITKINLLLEAF